VAYTDFTLDAVRRQFALTLTAAPLFPSLRPVALPDWLEPMLRRGMPSALNSEKSRSEFIVAPILLAVRELSGGRLSVYSGQRLNADASEGLDGECDYILSAAPPLPVLQAPLVCVVEAKKNDIESGLGQCAAQMLGAWRVNDREGAGVPAVHGCVTTGENWQFLRLAGQSLVVDSQRYYLDSLALVVSALLTAGGQVTVAPA
jgi:hypothetical protein